jgi:hypothetical protein
MWVLEGLLYYLEQDAVPRMLQVRARRKCGGGVGGGGACTSALQAGGTAVQACLVLWLSVHAKAVEGDAHNTGLQLDHCVA